MEQERQFYVMLGKKILIERKSRHLSQEELSGLASLQRTYIGMIERAERKPSILSVKKIADALNVSIDFLTQGTEE